MHKKVFLFDIDGTLLLTGGASRLALASAFEEIFGIAVSLPQLHTHGKTDPVIFGEIARALLERELTSTEFGQLRAGYSRHFAREIANASAFRLMAGVVPLLDMLVRSDGILLGIETGNFEETAWQKLERGGIRHYFKFGGFGSDSPDRGDLVGRALERAAALNGKPVGADQIFLVGDAPQDVAAGKRWALRTISVLTGASSRAEIEIHRPDLILDNLEAIDDFKRFVGI